MNRNEIKYKHKFSTPCSVIFPVLNLEEEHSMMMEIRHQANTLQSSAGSTFPQEETTLYGALAVVF